MTIDDLKSKLILAMAIGAFILGMVPQVFAATSVHISARASDTRISSSTGVNSNESFFSNIDFNQLFMNFFGKRFKAEMSGAEEFPDPGDPDAQGKAKIKLDPDKNELCIDIKAENIEPATAAHIHFAPAGASGAVVVVLPTPDAEGEAEGCVAISNTLPQAIKDNPDDYYVNVHNSPYPNGALRGQLYK